MFSEDTLASGFAVVVGANHHLLDHALSEILNGRSWSRCLIIVIGGGNDLLVLFGFPRKSLGFGFECRQLLLEDFDELVGGDKRLLN